MTPAFDEAAPDYDREFSRTGLGKAVRAIVHDYLSAQVLENGKPMSVLDLGCGTGEDAAFLAGKGHRVLATDQSPAMLEAARTKIESLGLETSVTFQRLDLTRDLPSDFEGRFELIFSNFGALNCLSPDSIRSLCRSAARWLRPGGRMVWVVMPRFCLTETAYFLLRGRWKAAFRRVGGGPVHAAVSGASVSTWYHQPRFLASAAAPDFEVAAVKPVGLAIPASPMIGFCERHPGFLSIFERIERGPGRCSRLAALSDHALIDLRRVGKVPAEIVRPGPDLA